MRIGFDAKRVFYNFRGLGNYSRTLLESLDKFYPENEYHLYTPTPEDPRGFEWIKKFPSFKVHTPEGILARSFSSAWRSIFLTHALAANELDIYHGLSHELPPGISKLPLKSVVTIHDLIFMRFPDFFPWVDRQVYMKKFKYACDTADLIVAICEQTKRDLMEFLNVPESKIRVVYQSVHPRFYNPIPEEKVTQVLKKYEIDRPYILFVGALEERKNALSLVKAFVRIKDRVDHGLVLVGEGKQYKLEIEKLITELGLGERVKIIEDVTTTDLPFIYRGCDVFCYPSHFEGFGIPIVEALFCERAVITSKGSCFPEAGGESTIYIDPNNIEQIANALEDTLGDSEKRKMMGRTGRQYVEKFHWRNTSQAMMKVYSELAGLDENIEAPATEV